MYWRAFGAEVGGTAWEGLTERKGWVRREEKRKYFLYLLLPLLLLLLLLLRLPLLLFQFSKLISGMCARVVRHVHGPDGRKCGPHVEEQQ